VTQNGKTPPVSAGGVRANHVGRGSSVSVGEEHGRRNPLGLPLTCGRTFQSFDLRLRSCGRPEHHEPPHMPYSLPGEPVPWGPADEAREIAFERLREAIDEGDEGRRVHLPPGNRRWLPGWPARSRVPRARGDAMSRVLRPGDEIRVVHWPDTRGKRFRVVRVQGAIVHAMEADGSPRSFVSSACERSRKRGETA